MPAHQIISSQDWKQVYQLSVTKSVLEYTSIQATANKFELMSYSATIRQVVRLQTIYLMQEITGNWALKVNQTNNKGLNIIMRRYSKPLDVNSINYLKNKTSEKLIIKL